MQFKSQVNCFLLLAEHVWIGWSSGWHQLGLYLLISFVKGGWLVCFLPSYKPTFCTAVSFIFYLLCSLSGAEYTLQGVDGHLICSWLRALTAWYRLWVFQLLTKHTFKLLLKRCVTFEGQKAAWEAGLSWVQAKQCYWGRAEDETWRGGQE